MHVQYVSIEHSIQIFKYTSLHPSIQPIYSSIDIIQSCIYESIHPLSRLCVHPPTYLCIQFKHVSIYPSICTFNYFYTSLYPPSIQPIYAAIHQYIHVCTYPSIIHSCIPTSILQSIHFISPSANPSIHLHIYLSIHLTTNAFIHLSVHSTRFNSTSLHPIQYIYLSFHVFINIAIANH